MRGFDQGEIAAKSLHSSSMSKSKVHDLNVFVGMSASRAKGKDEAEIELVEDKKE